MPNELFPILFFVVVVVVVVVVVFFSAAKTVDAKTRETKNSFFIPGTL